MPNDIETPERARDRGWYGDTTRRYYCSCGQSVITLARSAFDSGFGYGMRYAIKRTGQVTPYISQFIDLITFVFGREDYYADLYLAALAVHKSMGRSERDLRKLGEALARISNGEVSEQSTTTPNQLSPSARADIDACDEFD